jgi:hypothetical protein
VEVQLHVFLTSALDGGEWLTSRPGRFTLGVRAPQYPVDMRLGGLQRRKDNESGGGEGMGEQRSRHPQEANPI